MINDGRTQGSEKLLSTRAVAEILSLSPRTVHRLNSTGLIIKPLRISGRLRYRHSELMDWLQANMPDRRTFEAMQRAGGGGQAVLAGGVAR